MKRLDTRFVTCAFVALALALWGIPFGQVAQASELTGARIAPQAEGRVWDGSADTSWYSADGVEFTLTTPEQLAGLAAITNGEALGIERDDFTGKTVTLGADVMLNATAATGKDAEGQRNWAPIGKIIQIGVDYSKGYAAPTYDYSGRFNGTFDGAGHVVKNIYRYTKDEEYGGFSGLFGVLGSQAVVTSVGVEDGYVYGRVVGGIAAASRVGIDEMPSGGPLIDRCFNSAKIEGNGSSTRAVGGIFGGQEAYDVSLDSYQAMARIENCHNAGDVDGGTAGAPTGGIAGYGSLRIVGCFNEGSVSRGGDDVRGQIAGAVLKAGYQNGNHGTGVGDLYGGFVRNCNSKGTGALYHELVNSGDEAKGSATGVKQSLEDAVFPLDGYPWVSEPSPDAYSAGKAFVVTQVGSTRVLQLRWMVDADSVELTDACIVGGVDKAYLRDGSAVAPKPIVRVDGKKLVEGDDYSVSYRVADGSAVDEPLAPGAYEVVVTSKAFSGSASRAFSIEEPWLSVYARSSAAEEPTLVRRYLKDEVKALVSTSGKRVSAMYGATASDGTDGDSWHVATSVRYVLLDELLADAGAPDWKAGAMLKAADSSGKSATLTYEELQGGWFYPEATQRGFSTESGAEVPAALALFCGEKEVASNRTAEYAQNYGATYQSPLASPRLLCGVSKADYAAKRFPAESRLVKGVSSLTVTAGEPPALTDLSTASVTVPDQVYSGKELTPSVTVKVGTGVLEKGADYALSYSENTNVGLAKVTVTAVAGSGKYTGSKTVSFKINPKGTKLVKLTRGKKRLTASWKKQRVQTTGYQLMLATSAKFSKGKKTVTVKNAKAARVVVKGLKGKTKYWAKVRTYKSVGKATYCSTWSKPLSAKTT